MARYPARWSSRSELGGWFRCQQLVHALPLCIQSLCRWSATPSKITSSPIRMGRPRLNSVLPPRYTSLPTRTLRPGERATDRCALSLLTLRARHTWDHESPSRRSSLTRTPSILTRGLPNRLPLARATVPNFVPSGCLVTLVSRRAAERETRINTRESYCVQAALNR